VGSTGPAAGIPQPIEGREGVNSDSRRAILKRKGSTQGTAQERQKGGGPELTKVLKCLTFTASLPGVRPYWGPWINLPGRDRNLLGQRCRQ
jgi:hypothetical protein